MNCGHLGMLSQTDIRGGGIKCCSGLAQKSCLSVDRSIKALFTSIATGQQTGDPQYPILIKH